MKFIVLSFLMFVSGCFSCATQNISVKAVVNIKNVGTLSGTAFKVEDIFGNLHTLTAGHVCESMLAGNAVATFEYLDGKWISSGGKYGVLKMSQTSDICELYVIEPGNNKLKHLKLASDWAPKEPISMYGAPLGIYEARTDGYLIGRFVNVMYAQLHALPGNSGSPVLNSEGDVLGMLVAGYMNISVLVPYQEIEAFLYEK